MCVNPKEFTRGLVDDPGIHFVYCNVIAVLFRRASVCKGELHLFPYVAGFPPVYQAVLCSNCSRLRHAVERGKYLRRYVSIYLLRYGLWIVFTACAMLQARRERCQERNTDIPTTASSGLLLAIFSQVVACTLVFLVAMTSFPIPHSVRCSHRQLSEQIDAQVFRHSDPVENGSFRHSFPL